jgi:hypothetical protein
MRLGVDTPPTADIGRLAESPTCIAHADPPNNVAETTSAQ